MVCLVWVCEGLGHGRVGGPVIPCVTEDLYMEGEKEGERKTRTCAEKGPCDRPEYRDQHGTSNIPIVIRTAVHVMNSLAGAPPDGLTRLPLHSLSPTNLPLRRSLTPSHCPHQPSGPRLRLVRYQLPVPSIVPPRLSLSLHPRLQWAGLCLA